MKMNPYVYALGAVIAVLALCYVASVWRGPDAFTSFNPDQIKTEKFRQCSAINYVTLTNQTGSRQNYKFYITCFAPGTTEVPPVFSEEGHKFILIPEGMTVALFNKGEHVINIKGTSRVLQGIAGQNILGNREIFDEIVVIGKGSTFDEIKTTLPDKKSAPGYEIYTVTSGGAYEKTTEGAVMLFAQPEPVAEESKTNTKVPEDKLNESQTLAIQNLKPTLSMCNAFYGPAPA